MSKGQHGMVFVRIVIGVDHRILVQIQGLTYPSCLFLTNTLPPFMATGQISLARLQRRAEPFQPMHPAPMRQVQIQATGHHDDPVTLVAVIVILTLRVPVGTAPVAERAKSVVTSARSAAVTGPIVIEPSVALAGERN